MIWGHCRVCEKRVPIQPRGTWEGTRNAKWFPVEHVGMGEDSGGKACPGSKEAL